MTTNFAELINSILKKSRNLPIGALVKSTYVRCNALFNERRRKTATMLTSGKVCMKILNKTIEDAHRKENTQTTLEFNRRDTHFLVQETINLREVQPAGDFTIRLDERCNNPPCRYNITTLNHVNFL